MQQICMLVKLTVAAVAVCSAKGHAADIHDNEVDNNSNGHLQSDLQYCITCSRHTCQSK